LLSLFVVVVVVARTRRCVRAAHYKAAEALELRGMHARAIEWHRAHILIITDLVPKPSSPSSPSSSSPSSSSPSIKWSAAQRKWATHLAMGLTAPIIRQSACLCVLGRFEDAAALLPRHLAAVGRDTFWCAHRRLALRGTRARRTV
jgi:hypothetical protein